MSSVKVFRNRENITDLIIESLSLENKSITPSYYTFYFLSTSLKTDSTQVEVLRRGRVNRGYREEREGREGTGRGSQDVLSNQT